jgi:hypothetical protein
MKSLLETYIEEFSGIHYCQYCLTVKTNQSCCSDDFIDFKYFGLETQKQIIQQELDKGFKHGRT